MSQQEEEGGFHTSCQLFLFFPKLYFFMISSLHVFLQDDVMTTAFLAVVFVCVLLHFSSQGYPDSCSPSGDACVWRWKWRGGGGGGWRDRLSLAGGKRFFPLYWPPSLPPCLPPSLPPSPSTGARGVQPEAAVSHSEGFHSCPAPELCVIHTHSPKQWQSLLVRFLFPSLSHYPLLGCVVTQRQGTPEKRREKKRRKKGGRAAGACGSKFLVEEEGGSLWSVCSEEKKKPRTLQWSQ